MHGFALVLVVAAAFMQATWNFLAKRARGGAAIVWLYDVVSIIIYAPLALVILLYYSDLVIHVGLLAPYAVYNWSEVSREWNMHRFEVIGIAILGPLSYFIILSVLVFTPVSYVAPLREISVLIGTLMGTRFLAEGNTRRRLLAACVMVAGIIALAV